MTARICRVDVPTTLLRKIVDRHPEQQHVFHADNTLPIETCRIHWTDGRVETRRLGQVDA